MTLSPREREVVGLLAQGLTRSAIARRLHLGRATVETHIHRASQKIPGPHPRTVRLVLWWNGMAWGPSGESIPGPPRFPAAV